MAFSLDGKLKLDARDFVQGAGKAKKAVGEVGDEFGKLPREAGKAADGVEDEFEDMSDSGGKIGSNFGGKMIGGFAALGVGAAIGGMMLQGMQTAIERDQIERTMQGKFDITAKEAERFGKIAGGLYADGWGDGLEEVATLVAKSSRQLGIETDEALSDISSQVAATAQTFGEDFDAVLRSTSQLMENELAPSAEAALDLVVGAFQNGGDEAGDLLDTIDEYSQHWAAMGLSGEDALNQVVHGLQNGQRDADKMADAVKEMRLRVVENSDQVRTALENIGLDADKTVQAFIEGGPAARDAFLKVVKALKNGQTQGDDTADAVAIIGTQFEDLGPKALESLLAVDGALENTAGKAEELADIVARRDPAEEFKRSWSEALGWLGTQGIEEFDSAMMGLADIFSPGTSDMIDYSDSLADAATAARDFDLATLGSVSSYDEARAAAVKHAKQIGLSEDAHNNANDAVTDFANQVTSDWADAQEEIRKQQSKTSKSHREHTEEWWKMGGAAAEAEGLIDSAGRVISESGDDARTAAGKINSYERSLETAARDADSLEAAAGRLKTQLSDRSAFLNVRDALNEMTAAGDATEQELIDVRGEVANYIADIGNVPAATLTEIDTLVNEGQYQEALRRLQELEKDRQARIDITTYYTTVGSSSTPVQPNQGGRNARGTDFFRGGRTLVGEEGPEVVELPRGSRIYNAQDTRRMMADTPSMTPAHSFTSNTSRNASIALTVNAGMGADGPAIGETIVNHLETFYRSGGSAPVSAVA